MLTPAPFSWPTFVTLDASSFPRDGPWRVATYFLLVLVPLIVLLNITVLTACALSRFHKPMVVYISFSTVADTLWTLLCVGMFVNGLLAGQQRLMFYKCLVQLFCIELLYIEQGVMLLLIDIDRFWAIFWPYSYTTQMARKRKSLYIVGLATILPVLIISSYPVMVSALSFCVKEVIIADVFCFMDQVLVAACGRTQLPAVMMMCVWLFVDIITATSIIYSTVKILRMFRHNRQAMYTCGTQVMAFAVRFSFATMVFVTNNVNFQNTAFRFMLYLTSMMSPPVANPLIYGLRIKEIRQPLKRHLKIVIYITVNSIVIYITVNCEINTSLYISHLKNVIYITVNCLLISITINCEIQTSIPSIIADVQWGKNGQSLKYENSSVDE
uniref:G-protein coupled receptors family 1 profile domain-containing protein n=1 Tax=Eptatretus burgeri TaxID=7764 RepID=A0A8C4QIS4_EPTBU